MIPQSLQKHFTAPVLHCKKLVKVQEGRRIRETAWKILREFQAQGFFFHCTPREKQTAPEPLGSAEDGATRGSSICSTSRHTSVAVSPALPTAFPPRKIPNGLMLFLNSQEMSAFSVSEHSELLSILAFGMSLPKGGSDQQRVGVRGCCQKWGRAAELGHWLLSPLLWDAGLFTCIGAVLDCVTQLRCSLSCAGQLSPSCLLWQCQSQKVGKGITERQAVLLPWLQKKCPKSYLWVIYASGPLPPHHMVLLLAMCCWVHGSHHPALSAWTSFFCMQLPSTNLAPLALHLGGQ